MPEDSINTLVGTFSNVSATNITSIDTMSQCICIDTSTNRIGINNLDPSFAIDITKVAGSNVECIRTPRLIISDISRLTFANNIINSSNIYLLVSGEIYVDASNYLRLR